MRTVTEANRERNFALVKHRVSCLDVAERETPLRKSGGVYRGPCFFHGGENPSSFCLMPSEAVPGAPLASTYDGLVTAWKTTEREAETRLWRLTEIASSLCGNFDADAVKMFARQVHYTHERIYELAKAWQLRMSMPEHRESVGEWKPGRYLSVSHFVCASYFPDPQSEIREAVRGGVSSTKMAEKRKQMLKPSERRQSQIEPEKKYVRSPVRKPTTGDHAPLDMCESCHSPLAWMANLATVANSLGVNARELSEASDVPASVIEDLMDGRAVAQVYVSGLVRAVQELQKERAYRRERMGLHSEA